MGDQRTHVEYASGAVYVIEMDFILQLLGRLHPLVVHLPIGILLIGFLFEWLGQTQRFRKLKSAVQPILLFGALSAVAACVTGYLLSQEGGYAERILSTHQYLGIATATSACLLYFFRKRIYKGNKMKRKRARLALFSLVIILLSITGHLGGSLTHGEDYMVDFYEDKSEASSSIVKLGAVAMTDSAILFRDVVYPILEAKCLSCHSSRKQKGDLRLDGMEFILKGGEHGSVLKAGLPDSSSLYARLVLPLENEHHMPPNEKSQLSSAAIDAIHAWVKNGYDFDMLVSAYEDHTYLKKAIRTIKMDETPQYSWVPTEDVVAADPAAIEKLTLRDILVMPVADDRHYVKANFINVKTFQSTDIDLLLAIKEQLVWLDLTQCAVSDADVERVGLLQNLRYLYLRDTKISDEGMTALSKLSNLQYINLSDTEVTGDGLKTLLDANHLSELYVYNSKAASDDLKILINAHPNIHIDTGGYQLPILDTDTIVYE